MKNLRVISYLVLALLPTLVFIAPALEERFRLSQTAASVLLSLPLIAFAVLGFLGLKLNQTRILITSLILLALFYLLRNPDFLKVFGVGQVRLPQILAVFLPICFTLIFFFKESRPFSVPSLRLALLGFLPLAFFVLLLLVMPDSFDKLFKFTFAELPVKTRLPQATFFMVLFLATATWFEKDNRVRPFRVSLLVCMLPLLAAFHIALVPGADPEQTKFFLDLSLLCVSLILLHTMFSMYWQRVYVDELTGAPNRRALEEKLLHLSGNYSLAMVDIDKFKRFNDEYGHDEGDNALRLVADHLIEETGNRAYRYGGEEFVAVFDGHSAGEAGALMDRCRTLLAGRDFFIRKAPKRTRKKTSLRGKTKTKGKRVRITVSVGVAGTMAGAADYESVLKRADKALYELKHAGRNKVTTVE